MDHSELGIRSRKTGIRARENVRRDDLGMEDVTDFFADDNTLVSDGPVNDKPNGTRLTFGPEIHNNANSRPNKNSPLRSPLPTHGHDLRPSSSSSARNLHSNITEDDNDIFDDALENPNPNYNSNDNNESGSNMDIDDESRGSIRVVNEPHDISFANQSLPYSPEDDHHIPIHPSNTPQIGHRLLFGSVDGGNKSLEERQLELERNTTVRSSARRVGNGSRNTPTTTRNRTPTRIPETSPLNSLSGRLHSPLKPSSKSIAHLSKSIATTDKRRPQVPLFPSVSDEDSMDDYVNDNSKEMDDSEDSEDFIQTTSRKVSKAKETKPEIRKAQSSNRVDSVTISKPTKRLKRGMKVTPQPNRSRGETIHQGSSDINDEEEISERGRGRSTKRSVETRSPSRPKEHYIDVNKLRQEQESRASSKPPNGQTTRRSSRVRIPPLAYWRNERVVYNKGMKESTPSLKEVVRVDEPIPIPRSRAPSRMGSRAPSKSRQAKPSRSKISRAPSKSRSKRRIEEITEEDEEDLTFNEKDEDEDDLAVTNGDLRGSEWLKQGFHKVDTFEGHGSDAKTNRLIAWAPGTENFSTTVKSSTDDFKLAILFDKNREFIATGMMSIPPGGIKSLKGTDTTYFVFYCISGIIEVTLSGNVFLIKKGCSLEVPMGNFYQFVNKGKKDATLFFVQTRGHDVSEWDDE